MRLGDKKQILLYQLGQEAEPVSLQELLQKLGKGYAERSLRRWLSELEEEGLIEKTGQKRGTKYRARDRSSRDLVPGTNCFTPESSKIIEQIQRPIFERMPVTYSQDWFHKYRPNVTFYIPSHLRDQLHKAGRRLKNDDPAGTYARQIFNRLLIDLSYNSSRLEGNTYSLLDTEKLLFQGASAEGKLDEEKTMILNHKEAIRHLVDTAKRLEVTQETIYTLHYLLSEGLIEGSQAGKIRNHGVRIGGSTYMPMEDPKQLEAQLKKIVEKAAQIGDPYEQSFFLLAHLSYLQAFSDVNKRTARLSANIPLIVHNLVPLSFNDVGKEDYTSAMIAVYEFQKVHPLVDLYVFSYMRTCAMYDSTLRAMGFDEVRVRYRQERRTLIREIIQQKLVGKKMDAYIASSSIVQAVKSGEKELFLEDLREDLEEICPSRIAGLGISLDELEAWKQL